MCRVHGRMDQVLYRSILEQYLLGTIEDLNLSKDKLVFMHDNDPKHTANSVWEWLQNQRITVMAWPPQSPDLNPIEHVWAQLKYQLLHYDKPPAGINELWERIKVEWPKIDSAFCSKLYASMPKRMKAVIKAKGGWTSY